MTDRNSRVRMKHGEAEAIRLAAIRTQTEVAKLLGITQSAVYHAERNALLKVRRRLLCIR